MPEQPVNHIIPKLRNRRRVYAVLGDLLLSLALAFLVITIGRRLWAWSYAWGIVAWLSLFMLIAWRHRFWQFSESGIAQSLDQRYPELEESSWLLLRPYESLNRIELLQYHRTQRALSAIPSPLVQTGQLLRPILTLVASLLMGMLILRWEPAKAPQQATAIPAKGNRVSTRPPQVDKVDISIAPPAYTAKQSRRQQDLDIVAEENAVVSWQLSTTIAAHQLTLILNDSLRIKMRAVDSAATQWRLDRQIKAPGFYQFVIDGQVSELYKIEMIADKAPVIIIRSPQPFTTIDFGEPKTIKILAELNDDYGLNRGVVVATIASGHGEAVKFKEQQIPLAGFQPGRPAFHLHQTIALDALGMQPGDECYFFVEATDNHLQTTRSDIYIVQMPDTAALMSLEGLANTVTLKPEYFRSQRQIIIETEQLIRDKDSISTTTFRNKSNNLGIDQKLLRLRYGKFLGEEGEEGELNVESIQEITDYSNAEKIRDAFTDKHDNAEDASFYGPETKKQLRATLTEMWNAEIKLRTFAPEKALVFEYKALRLLKDLQQQSRVYVAKTSTRITPPDPAKRLKGEMKGIEEQKIQKNIERRKENADMARQALSVLDGLKAGTRALPAGEAVLQQAYILLQHNAALQPAIYLPAVESLKKMLNATRAEGYNEQDIAKAQKGLQQLLSRPMQEPVPGSGSRQELTRSYFENLQKHQP